MAGSDSENVLLLNS